MAEPSSNPFASFKLNMEPVEEIPVDTEYIKRKEEIKNLISQKFYSDTDFDQIATKVFANSTDDFDEDEFHDYVSYLKNTHGYNLNDISTFVEENNIPDEELSGYLDLIFNGADNLKANPDDMNEHQGYVKSLARASPTVDDAIQNSNFAADWRKTFADSYRSQDTKDGIKSSVDFFNALNSLTDFKVTDKSKKNNLPEDVKKELFLLSENLYKFKKNIPRYLGVQPTNILIDKIIEVGTKTRSSENSEMISDVFQDMSKTDLPVDTGLFIYSLTKYGSEHGFNSEKLKGLKDGLLPAIRNKDPQIDILLKSGNVWGMGEGKFGAADFFCEAYADKVTPANLNKLFLILREVPAMDLSRHEQNRLDGLTLHDFENLRDMIHDEEIGVHEFVSAISKYYDETLSKDEFARVMQNTFGVFNKRKGEQEWKKFFDPKNYDVIVKEKVDGEEHSVPAINVIRRLVENTKVVFPEPPKVSDENLNELLINLFDKGENFSKEDLNKILTYVNKKLINYMDSEQIGVEPNFIRALAWIENKNAKSIKSMNYEEQAGANKQEWFKSILLFQELTGAAEKFDEKEFDTYINQLQKMSSEDAYKEIFKREIEKVYILSKRYTEAGKQNLNGSLWSGNTSHELVGLIDLKNASTSIGEKRRNEKLVPEYLRTTGD